jgi:hypothetical protein
MTLISPSWITQHTAPPWLLSDFFIFSKIKQHFKGPYYTSDEVKTAVRL